MREHRWCVIAAYLVTHDEALAAYGGLSKSLELGASRLVQPTEDFEDVQPTTVKELQVICFVCEQGWEETNVRECLGHPEDSVKPHAR